VGGWEKKMALAALESTLRSAFAGAVGIIWPCLLLAPWSGAVHHPTPWPEASSAPGTMERLGDARARRPAPWPKTSHVRIKKLVREGFAEFCHLPLVVLGCTASYVAILGVLCDTGFLPSHASFQPMLETPWGRSKGCL